MRKGNKAHLQRRPRRKGAQGQQQAPHLVQQVSFACAPQIAQLASSLLCMDMICTQAPLTPSHLQ